MELVIPSYEQLKQKRELDRHLSESQIRYVEQKFNEAFNDPSIKNITFSFGIFSEYQLDELAKQILEKGYKVNELRGNNELTEILVFLNETY